MSFSRKIFSERPQFNKQVFFFIIENIKNQFSSSPYHELTELVALVGHNQLGLKFITNRCLPDVNCMGLALTFYDIRIKQSFDRALKEKRSRDGKHKLACV